MAIQLEAKYPTEPLKCWEKAKELRYNYYRDYASAHEKGGIRWSGGAANFPIIPAGFGRDVYPLTGEPYGASVGFDKKFGAKCHAVTEEVGYPRDLCAYMRNYWGSKILNEYVLGGPFPKPDFYFFAHLCCSHGKWYQEAVRIEGEDRPILATDVSIGPCYKLNETTGEYYLDMPKNGVRYVVNQLHDQIEQLEKITGRPFQDELLFEAAENYFDNMTLWTKITKLNQTVPAPLDEKSMFSLYVFSALNQASKEFADFYRELLDEVQDRVDRGIAALATERKRIMSDIQPPWGFLKIFRYLEQYGCVSIGSLYSMCLVFPMLLNEDGTLSPRPTPKELGIEIKDRDQCLTLAVEFFLSNFGLNNFYGHDLKGRIMKKIYEQWHCDGVIMHYNRGCEGVSLNVAENRLYLAKHGIPVVTYEGNMGDEREFDIEETQGRIDSFMESLGLK